ncbi:MAG: DUF6596 domain-containing protein [Planctomycetota bacterium]
MLDWPNLFRREYPAIVASLVKRLGRARLDLAEDAAQEALARAVADWRVKGPPDRPGAWLSAVAWRCAIDALRQSSREQDELPPDLPAAPAADAPSVPDDALRLLFLCAHPSLPREDQIALTLKAACGFGTAEIARAFFLDEATLAQRIVRAKKRLRDKGASFEIPAPEELPPRLDAVLDVIYLAFNEGYTPRDADAPLRRDVALEALRLARLAAPVAPRAEALAALLCFQSSRFAARISAVGELLPLEEQDRAMWDRPLIAEGIGRLAAAAKGDRVSEYHLLAGIAVCHAAATSVDATDWTRIATLYAELERRTPTWLVRLNRAVAISYADGPAAGLAAIEALPPAPGAASHLFHAARADAMRRMKMTVEAAAGYRAAAAAAPSLAERVFFERRAGLLLRHPL